MLNGPRHPACLGACGRRQHAFRALWVFCRKPGRRSALHPSAFIPPSSFLRPPRPFILHPSAFILPRFPFGAQRAETSRTRRPNGRSVPPVPAQNKPPRTTSVAIKSYRIVKEPSSALSRTRGIKASGPGDRQGCCFPNLRQKQNRSNITTGDIAGREVPVLGYERARHPKALRAQVSAFVALCSLSGLFVCAMCALRIDFDAFRRFCHDVSCSTPGGIERVRESSTLRPP